MEAKDDVHTEKSSSTLTKLTGQIKSVKMSNLLPKKKDNEIKITEEKDENSTSKLTKLSDQVKAVKVPNFLPKKKKDEIQNPDDKKSVLKSFPSKLRESMKTSSSTLDGILVKTIQSKIKKNTKENSCDSNLTALDNHEGKTQVQDENLSVEKTNKDSSSKFSDIKKNFNKTFENKEQTKQNVEENKNVKISLSRFSLNKKQKEENKSDPTNGISLKFPQQLKFVSFKRKEPQKPDKSASIKKQDDNGSKKKSFIPSKLATSRLPKDLKESKNKSTINNVKSLNLNFMKSKPDNKLAMLNSEKRGPETSMKLKLTNFINKKEPATEDLSNVKQKNSLDDMNNIARLRREKSKYQWIMVDGQWRKSASIGL